MVYRLRPLQLELDCEEGPYKLGERIDLTVELTPNADVDVREGRVDLVCEERLSRTERSIQMGMGGPGAIQGTKMKVTTDYRTSTVLRQSDESYVHSSVVFLEDTRLSAGRTSSYHVRLEFQPVPPRHLDDAVGMERDATSSLTFKWTVVASVNIVRGRDPKRQRMVKVTLPGADEASSDTGQRLINRPGKSHQKAPTGPAA